MSDRVFVDSNIFLYAFCTKDLRKQKIAADIVTGTIFISTQVINEVSNNMLKKLGFVNHDISAFVEDCYARYSIGMLGKEIFTEAAYLRDRYYFSYYDSLIVAAALWLQCDILLSEDMQNGLVIDEALTIVNPFLDVRQ